MTNFFLDLYELTELNILCVFQSLCLADAPVASSVAWGAFAFGLCSLWCSLGGLGFRCSLRGQGNPCVFLLRIWNQLFFQGAQGQVSFNFESL